MQNRLIELLGWFGVFSILAAYIGLTLEEFSSDSLVYQFLNLFGSVAILVDAWKDKNYQPVALNLVWGVVAIIGLVSIVF